jgi:hypothetical protein
MEEGGKGRTSWVDAMMRLEVAFYLHYAQKTYLLQFGLARETNDAV